METETSLRNDSFRISCSRSQRCARGGTGATARLPRFPVLPFYSPNVVRGAIERAGQRIAA